MCIRDSWYVDRLWDEWDVRRRKRQTLWSALLLLLSGAFVYGGFLGLEAMPELERGVVWMGAVFAVMALAAVVFFWKKAVGAAFYAQVAGMLCFFFIQMCIRDRRSARERRRIRSSCRSSRARRSMPSRARLKRWASNWARSWTRMAQRRTACLLYTSQAIQRPKKRLFIALIAASLGLTALSAYGIWKVSFAGLQDISVYLPLVLGMILAGALSVALIGLAGIVLAILGLSSAVLFQRQAWTAINLLFPIAVVLGKCFEIDKERVERSFIEVSNQIIRNRRIRVKPEELLLLAPQMCIRDSRRD